MFLLDGSGCLSRQIHSMEFCRLESQHRLAVVNKIEPEKAEIQRLKIKKPSVRFFDNFMHIDLFQTLQLYESAYCTPASCMPDACACSDTVSSVRTSLDPQRHSSGNMPLLETNETSVLAKTQDLGAPADPPMRGLPARAPHLIR